MKDLFTDDGSCPAVAAQDCKGNGGLVKCLCFHLHGHAATLQHQCACGYRWMTPPPPTGPEVPRRRKGSGTYEQFVDYTRTKEGQETIAFIKHKADTMRGDGAKRISVKHLAEVARVHLYCKLHNNWTPYIADLLVECDPRLLDLITRKKRKAVAE